MSSFDRIKYQLILNIEVLNITHFCKIPPEYHTDRDVISALLCANLNEIAYVDKRFLQ
jgi:hypothetical protein